MRWSPVSALVLLLLLVSTATPDAAGVYYCLESYRPIGQQLQRVQLNTKAAGTKNSTQSLTTSGQVARQCAAACDAAAACTGFRAVGPEVPGGGTCELLANSTESLPAALAFQSPSSPWPKVHDNLTSADSIALRSVSWMCWRQQQDWDAFGRATNNMISSGDVAGDGTDWCAFGVDVAGTNLRRDYINITQPKQCGAFCKQNATGCTFWIFVASRPEDVQVQQERNCFAKADVFKGQNGWTGKPKADIWNADSQVTCFSSQVDWRHLGLVMNPSIKTIDNGGSFYTVYPERVTWSEAAATCRKLPGGQLAILNSQNLIDKISQDLLATLPFQTAVRSAWVGAIGNNTAFNPDAPNVTDLALAAQSGNGSLKAQLPPQEQLSPSQLAENTLRWTGGLPVAQGLLRRPDTLDQLWTVHDVVWSQQYVPESSREVCGRVMVQLPPSKGPVNPASVLPGVWYYDCMKPAAFICQSSAAPTEPMSGREVAPQKVESPDTQGDIGGSSLQPWKTALAVILPVLAMALLAYQVFHVFQRKMSRLPELIRQQRKRALGQPRTGRMSLVMTDIQGFTHLMQGDADQTTQALLLHNSVIKHAVYQNVGWVVEQEGDSFSVVFHEAEDAVAFTLQVQQALLQQSWPPAVTYYDDWEGATTTLDCTAPPTQPAAAAGATPEDAAAAAAALATCTEANTPHSSRQESFTWQIAAAHGDRGGGYPAVAAAAAAAAAGPERSQPSSSSSSVQGLAAAAAGGQQQQQQGLPPWLRGGKSSSFTVGNGGGIAAVGHRRSHSLDNGSPRTDQQQQQAAMIPIPSTTLQHADSNGSSLSGILGRHGSISTPGGDMLCVNDVNTHQGSPASFLRDNSAISEEWGSRVFKGWGRALSPSTSSMSVLSQWGGSTPGMQSGSSIRERGSREKGSKPRNLWLFQQLLSPRQEQGKLFSGLRVRMGVVTGEVERGQELKSSALYRRVQDVSNAAHGGQVLMDAATFTAVKEAMWRLGAVGPAGMDYDALLATKSTAGLGKGGAGGGSSCCGEGCLPGGGFRSGVSTMSPLPGSQLASSPGDLAIALDMGCYEVLTAQEEAAAADHQQHQPFSLKGVPGKPRQACIQLWTKELGEKLVAQYQQYLQQQISSGRDLSLLNPEDETGLEDNNSCGDCDEEAPYTLGLNQNRKPHKMLQGNSHAQQQQQGGVSQQQQQQQRPPAGRSNSSSFGKSPFGGLAVATSAGGRHHKEHHGLVGRSASMTVPHSWQAMTSSLFGVGVVPAADKGADKSGRGFDGYSSSSQSHERRSQLLGYCSISALVRPSLRLYQVVPPSLVGRAALFGQGLDLPPNWHLLDAPYFAAPGLNSASSILAAQGAGGHTSGPAPATGDDGTGMMTNPGIGRVPGRSRSDVYPLLQQLRQMRGASFTQEVGSGLGSLPSLTEGDLQAPTAAAAAAAAAAAGALQQGPAGALSVEGGGGDGCGVGASLLSLLDTQRRLSSGNETDAGPAMAAMAAMAAAGPQGDGSSAVIQPQQQQMGSSLARLQSCSIHGGQQHLLRESSNVSQQQQQQQQQQVLAPTSPTATTGITSSSSSSNKQSLLMLRAASLQLNVAQKVLMAAGGERRASGGQRARLAGPTRPLFPPVTILFAAVEGSADLLRFPALARSVHGMLHHLMLQLLRSFPGSYLVRAQQGDLKYMLAFTCPAAAVGWGLTLQEAALYLPYPQEVLRLCSCGVQLDQGGRLVFRGPRFKMGLSEGTPKIIMPDHLGRADYHGSFVNLAARYAAVAAQGGQLVTDADLARQILTTFKAAASITNTTPPWANTLDYHTHISSSVNSSSVSTATAGHEVEGVTGGALGTSSSSSSSAMVTAGGPLSSSSSSNGGLSISAAPRSWTSLLQQHSRAAAAAAGGSRSPTSTEQQQQQVAAPDAAQSQGGPQEGGASAFRVPDSTPSQQQQQSPSSSHVLVIQPEQHQRDPSADPTASAPSTAAAAAAAAGGGATAEVAVECCWLGSFLFKGNPSPVSMVSFGPSVLAGRQYAPLSLSSGKGVRVLQRVGVMDRTMLHLPAAVEGFVPWEGGGPN